MKSLSEQCVYHTTFDQSFTPDIVFQMTKTESNTSNINVFSLYFMKLKMNIRCITLYNVTETLNFFHTCFHVYCNNFYMQRKVLERSFMCSQAAFCRYTFGYPYNVTYLHCDVHLYL